MRLGNRIYRSGVFIVNRKNKETLSSPGRFGFLTEPAQGVLLILNFTIVHNFLLKLTPMVYYPV